MAESPSPTATQAGARGPESLLDLVRGVLRDVPGLIGDRVELFSLEMHRAALVLVKVLALTVVAAILGVTAWLVAWSIVVGLLVAAGWSALAANGGVVLINVVATIWAARRVRRLMTRLSLPATRQHLMLGTGSSTQPVQPNVSRHEHPAAAA